VTIKYPAIPAPTADVQNLWATVMAQKQVLEILLGNIGKTNSNAAATWGALAASATTDTTNAGNITSGTLAPGRFPLAYYANVPAADIGLTTASVYFDGPAVAQGTSGVWLVSGTVMLLDNTTLGSFYIKLWDGVTIIASAYFAPATTAARTPVTLSGVIAAPAGNIKISMMNSASANGVMRGGTNGSGLGKDSILTAVRIG